MNKFILLVILLLSITPSYTEEVVEPIVEETPTEVVVDATEPIDETEATEASEEEEKVQSAYLSIMWEVITYIIVVLGSIVVFAAIMLLRKLGAKYGFEIPEIAEELIESLLLRCINRTEEWAKAQANKPSSEEKMANTIRLALERVTSNEKLRTRIEEKGKEIVEKLLRSKETSDEATPKES